MAQQGSIFSIGIDPRAVVDVLRRADLPVNVIGPEDDWRRLTVRPRGDREGSNGNALVMRLKTRQTDSVYFRKQLPAMATLIRRLGVSTPERQQAMTQLVPRLGTCIGMTAMPRFDQHPDFLEAITLVARTIDGMFYVPAAGFLDAESRPLLMEDGTYDAAARVPAVPDLTSDIDGLEILSDEDAASVGVEMPDARRVAERMFVMFTVAYRGLLETGEVPVAKRAAKLADLGDWFWSLEIGHELEPHEKQLLDTPLGELTEEQTEALVDTFEAVAVLAWGLRLRELPGHDCRTDPHHLVDALGPKNEDARFVIDSAELRDAIDLRNEADRILAVHWRLREWELNPAPLDFAKLTTDTWFGPIELSTLPLRRGDLAFNKKPISQADPQLVARCARTIVHRHRAINWLCGHNRTYSAVQTAT